MNDNTYNGWKNYTTWVTALWIDNDYESYQHRCELAEQVKANHEDLDERIYCLAANIKDWIEELNPYQEADLFADLLNSALSEVDWHEIAENVLSE